MSKDTVLLLTKAAELFVGYFARKCARTVSLRGTKSVREIDVIQTVYMHDTLEFLRLDFPRKSAAKQAVTATITSGTGDNHSTTNRGKLEDGLVPKHRTISRPSSKINKENNAVKATGKNNIFHFFALDNSVEYAPATTTCDVENNFEIDSKDDCKMNETAECDQAEVLLDCSLQQNELNVEEKGGITLSKD